MLDFNGTNLLVALIVQYYGQLEIDPRCCRRCNLHREATDMKGCVGVDEMNITWLDNPVLI